jgi:hypothetical protein
MQESRADKTVFTVIQGIEVAQMIQKGLLSRITPHNLHDPCSEMLAENRPS